MITEKFIQILSEVLGNSLYLRLIKYFQKILKNIEDLTVSETLCKIYGNNRVFKKF